MFRRHIFTFLLSPLIALGFNFANGLFTLLFVLLLRPQKSFIRIFHFYAFLASHFFISNFFLFSNSNRDRVKDTKGNSLNAFCYQWFSFVVVEIYFIRRNLFFGVSDNEEFPSREILIFIIHPILHNIFFSFLFFRVTSLNWENSHFIACNIFNFARVSTKKLESTDGFFFMPEFFFENIKSKGKFVVEQWKYFLCFYIFWCWREMEKKLEKRRTRKKCWSKGDWKGLGRFNSFLNLWFSRKVFLSKVHS